MISRIKYNKFTIWFFQKLMRFSRRFLNNYKKWIYENRQKEYDKIFQDGHTVYNYYNNIKINLFKSNALSKEIYRGFELEELNFTYSILEKGDTYLDIGANIGLFSLIAADKVGEDGKVISFEPDPNTYVKLLDNIRLNNFHQIETHNIGLSDKTTELNFYKSETGHDAWNSMVKNEAYGVENVIKVKACKLDEQLERIEKEKIKLVKIDVEGWEKFVVLGGKSFFKNYNPYVMVEFTEENAFNAGYFVQEIYDLLSDWGYSWYTIQNGKLVNEFKRLHYPYNNLIAKKGR